MAACLLAGACSPDADFRPSPSVFPGAYDAPPTRADTPMNAVEVQKATEDLITERNRLNAQAPSGQGQNPGPSGATGAKITANGMAKNAANSTAAPKAKAKNKASKATPQQTAAVPPATTASAQGAGVSAAGSDLKP